VLGYAQGAYADQVPVDPRLVLPLPKNLTFDQAAGMSVSISRFLFPYTE
jgi:NADPH:quinone reductase-like Zn-dependent oxidoreductase